MQKRLFQKILVILLLTIGLMVPIKMIDSLVGERQYRQRQVVEEVAAGYATAQQVVGPVIGIPWTRTVEEIEQPARAGDPPIRRQLRQEGVYYLFPARLQAGGKLDTGIKSRGLFEARVYQWKGHFSGSFRLPAAIELPEPASGRVLGQEWGQPWLGVAMDDPRGIIGAPALAWDGETLHFEKGSELKMEPRGIHALLPAWQPGAAREVDFAFDLGLRGTERLSLVPVGDDNRITLESSWPHPSFGGRFLPDPESQAITAEGFRAQWSISALAADAAQQVRRMESTANCPRGCAAGLDSLDVRLVEPVAIYTLSDRALKYAYLFVLLGFAAFFLFEVLKALPIHPIQYLLVGLALAVFFLLLLGLSEHLSFALAYALAAAACCGLIAIYLGAVLKGMRRGLGFGAALGGLFAALYVLLQSEDNALLLGSLLIFGLLAAAMVATRRVDWYALGRLAPQLEGQGR